MIDFFLPFQLAVKTPIGQFFFFLSILLAFLTSFFFFLKSRVNQGEGLIQQWQQDFSQRFLTRSPFSFVGPAKESFLGFESLAEDEHRRVGLLRQLYPSLVSQESWERFQGFIHSGENSSSHPSPYSWVECKDGAWYTWQTCLFNEEKIRSLSLKEALSKGQLRANDKEKILLEVAKELSKLHQQTFHGFFHLENIYLYDQSSSSIEAAEEKTFQVIFTDQGLYSSLDPQVFYEHFLKAKDKSLDFGESVEAFVKNLSLAPEQLRAPFEVGIATDMYLFGQLAFDLFTYQGVKNEENWEKLPLAWRSFVQQALDLDPQKRPADFEEIFQFLQQPELNLVFSSHNLHAPALSSKIDAFLQKDSPSNTKGKEQELAYAEKFFTLSQWKQAKNAYTHLLKSYPEDSLVLTNLAICHFELKEYDLARDFYNQAKSLQPEEARRYREHILA